MKVIKRLDTIIVFIFEKKYKNKHIEEIIKNVFNDLSNYYNYNIKNSYNLKIYINKYYGIIIEINEKNNNYYGNIIDINLKILNDVLFLYEIEDPLDYLDSEIYYYKDRYYVNLRKININTLENTNIIYGKEVYKIIGKGIKL